MYNVLENGLVGDGTTDDTAALQTLINTAIAAGRRTIFFPHTATGGEYYVTSLTNADQVDFIGDNCSFVGGYTGTIQNMGAIAELSAETVRIRPGDSDAEIAAALASGISSGKVIEVLAGTYNVSTANTITLTANQNLHIRALGKVIFNSSIPEPGSGSTGFLYVTGDGSNKVIIEGIELVHGATAVGAVHGLFFDNVDLSLYRVKGSGFSLYGIIGDNLVSAYAENCDCSDNRYAGLGLGGPGSVVVSGGRFNDNGVTGSADQGYGLIANGVGTYVSGVTAKNNNRYNLDCRGGNDVTITGCELLNAGHVGIYAVNENSVKDASNLKVIGCTIDNASRAGSMYAIWAGTFGASATKPYDEIFIDGCTIKNTLQQAIFISNSSPNSPDKITVAHCMIENATTQVIRIDNSAGGSVKDLIIHDNTVDGSIGIWNTENMNIHHNIFRASVSISQAIYVSGGTYGTFDHNQMIGSFTKPFQFDGNPLRFMNGNSFNGIGLKDEKHLTIQQRVTLTDNVAKTLLTITEPSAIAVAGVIMAKYMISGGYSTTPGVTAGQISVGFVFDAGHVITLPGASPYTITPFGTTSAADGTTFTLSWTIETTTNGVILKVTSDDSANNNSQLTIDYDILVSGIPGSIVIG